MDGDAETTLPGNRYAPKERLPAAGNPTEGTSLLGGLLPGALWARQESDRYGLAVVVTVPTEAVTALWWGRTNKLLIVGSLAGLALCFLLLRARRFGRDLIEARAEAERARAAHDRANQAKSEFLATMSHELRTPLNSVLGFAQLIRDEVLGPSHPKYPSYAGDIHDSGSHLLSLLNDILDLSKIEAGRKELAETAVDLDEIFSSVRKLTGTRASQRGVDVVFEETQLALYADERGLKQMLLNLVTNAVKFTPSGGQVRVFADRTQSDVQIVVEDTGIGMTLEQLEQAQQKFGQGTPDAEGSLEGTGLGLNVTRALAELHGGAMQIDRKWGVGTKVTIFLPVERVLNFDSNDDVGALEPETDKKTYSAA
jgi:signal transduction histidine kinase